MKKYIAIILTFVLLLSVVPIQSYAIENVGITVKMSSPTVQVGETVIVALALTGYTEGSTSVQALQIDVDDVDASVLEVVGHSTLIVDEAAIYNKTVYQEANNRLRLIYTRMSGALPSPYEDVFQFQLRVNADLTESGSITLPITVKMGTTEKTATVTTECVINYTVSDPDPDVVSVDIAWGAMSYTYSKGTWNTDTHSYGSSGWSDAGSGYVTVTNNGTVDTTATFSFTSDRDEISGTFTDGTSAITGAVDVPAGQSQTAYLVLAGKPTEHLSNTKIGTVTVRIGGE